MALGRISRKMMLVSLTPITRQPWTNSRLRSDRNSARVRRAGAGQETGPIHSDTVSRLGQTTATSTSKNRKEGRVWKAPGTRQEKTSPLTTKQPTRQQITHKQ